MCMYSYPIRTYFADFEGSRHFSTDESESKIFISILWTKTNRHVHILMKLHCWVEGSEEYVDVDALGLRLSLLCTVPH